MKDFDNFQRSTDQVMANLTKNKEIRKNSRNFDRTLRFAEQNEKLF